MQQLPKEIIIIIMEKLQLIELIKLSLVCKLFNTIVKTTKWKKNIIFGKNKIFLQNESISNYIVDLVDNNHIIDSASLESDDFASFESNDFAFSESLDFSEGPKKNCILEICISQTSFFKQIIKNISKIISECSIVFMSQDKKSKNPLTANMYILHLTENNVLLNLKLDAQHFECFNCESKITININMRSLYSALKNINNDNLISMHIEDNRDVLCIREININKNFIQENNICVSLMENFEFVCCMPVPDIWFNDVITMDSGSFHFICRHIETQKNGSAAVVEMTSNHNNKLLFQGQNKGRKILISYKDICCNNKTDYSTENQRQDKIIHNVYELKNLMSFRKCKKLCSSIEIYLKNDFPLFLVINIGTLGKLYVFIPLVDPIN
jgi:hypothetical protein